MQLVVAQDLLTKIPDTQREPDTNGGDQPGGADSLCARIGAHRASFLHPQQACQLCGPDCYPDRVEFVAFAVLVGYLLPWIAAVARQHHRHGPILAVTLLLGWTGFGWLLVLVYALTSDPQPPRLLRLVAGGAIGTARPLEPG